MAPSSKSKDPGGRKASREREGDETSSLNLWVGSLSPSIVDSDLIKVFKDHGAMDALTSYSPRTYAFVFFRTTEEAKKAKDELQGKVVKGSAMRIEFARTAKPGKYLWIGGLSQSFTKEQLEDELLQYGRLDDYKFMRDRNSALVGYGNLDDAIAAHKNINGKSLGGQQVRADFQKPQYSRRDVPEHINPRGSWSIVPQDARIAHDEIRNFHDLSDQGSKRHLLKPSQLHGEKRNGPLSNTLWIGYPSSVHVDEQMLHNAMILFGEIENIKSFPSRNYSFVEFRSIDEARRAKEGLQGRLFGDPRIQIMFSKSEFGPAKDSAPVLSGNRGSRPDIFNEAPLGPLEYLGHGLPMGPNTLPGQSFYKGPEMSMPMRSYSEQGFDPREENLDFHDFGRSVPNFSFSKQNTSGWRRQSSASGVHALSFGMRPSSSSMQGEWDDGFDMREAKRSRVDGSPINDARFHGRSVGGEVMGEMLLSHPERVIPGHNHSPVVRGAGHLHESYDIDLCWRGVIAKGGSPVCRARCVPIGKGLESPLPEVVNCFARTDLDMLTKHYGEAIGFDIVFFLPDSEEDFASYTEFLEYLGLKTRVGVAKCEDGTTLFLVPPSDFLTKILKVSGPERLYGVVLKLPHQSAPEMQQAQAPPHYGDQHQKPSSQDGYAPRNEEPALRMDYSNVLHENSVSHSDVGVSQPSEPYCLPSTINDIGRNPGATSKAEVSLTPELIAALASFLPPKSQSSIIGSNSMPSSSSVASFPSNLTAVSSEPAQGWIQGNQSTFSVSQLEPTATAQQQLHQSGSQYNMQVPLISQNPYASNLPSGPDNSVQSGLGQVQNFVSSVQQVFATPSRQLDNYALSQGQSFVPQNNQHYQHDSSFNSIYNAHGVVQASDSLATLNQQVQQPQAPANSSIQVQYTNMLPKQTSSITESSAQAQQQHMVPNMSAEGTSQADAEKNLRYQQTLQFAATLIQKIQQRSQSGGHAVGGSGNQL